MNNTHARLWHPWFRINRVLRAMLQTHGARRRGSSAASSSGGRSRCGARSGARPECLRSETLTHHRRARVAFVIVTLFADLDAFYQEHERCGDLDSGLDGDRVWMACACGAVIKRCADDDWNDAVASCDRPSSARLPPAIA